MPRQAPLRTIKRWKRYEPRASWRQVPRNTRGLYVLYRQRDSDYEVRYIGVAGISPSGGGGIRGRLKSHAAKKRGWTHFSFFEVHDNILRDEIRELEALLLGIFRHDSRIQLSNMQKGSSKLYKLRGLTHWKSS
jgi:hypothetical protein